MTAADLEADLFLVHAPAIYDFRERDDVFYAFLSDSESVNVTSMFEMYPVGFLALKSHLATQGLRCEIVNLASLMLVHPTLDVDRLLARLRAPVFGIDLHWMAHCHGSVELAARIKAVHPDATVIFGGISSTYYAEQLLDYPAIDVVVQGYDTLDPVARLVAAVVEGRPLDGIPNLVYRQGGERRRTGFSHKPRDSYNDAVVDWSFYQTRGQVASGRQIMTLPNTGCAHDCNWCGGSRFAYRRLMQVERTLIQKDHRKVVDELRTLGDQARETSIYALQCYSESRGRLQEYLDAVEELGIKSIAVEQFRLTDEATLRRLGRATKSYIMLSPESHDPEVSRLAGRGTYTMPELETWLPRALDAGIQGIFIWFFIGMQQQTPESVRATVDYCGELLARFRGKPVVPLICTMVPFLDPGSRFFEEPERHGYRIHHRTLEEHRRAMLEPSWHRRLNYDTVWLSRREIQDVSYDAVARLVELKGEHGALPTRFCRTVLAKIDETRGLLAEIEHGVELDGVVPAGLRDTVRRYNRDILSFTSNQLVPVKRPIDGKWYDDFTVPADLIASCLRP